MVWGSMVSINSSIFSEYLSRSFLLFSFSMSHSSLIFSHSSNFLLNLSAIHSNQTWKSSLVIFRHAGSVSSSGSGFSGSGSGCGGYS